MISVTFFGLVSELATHEQAVLLILEVFTDNSSKQHQSIKSISIYGNGHTIIQLLKQNLYKWTLIEYK